MCVNVDVFFWGYGGGFLIFFLDGFYLVGCCCRFVDFSFLMFFRVLLMIRFLS